MQQQDSEFAAPVGVVSRRDAPLVNKLMDDTDSSDYRVEIETGSAQDQAIWREFGHLASIGGAATLLLALSDWLKIGR